MDKENVPYIHKEVLLSLKEQTSVIFGKMDGTGGDAN
jgi:hypothetical protein